MSPKLFIQTFIFILSIICYSCATPDVDEGEVNKLRPNINTNSNTKINPNANIAEDNEIELNSLINLPFDPEENDYREDYIDENDEATGKKLTAVLKFNEEDTKSLVEQLKAKGQPFESKIDPELWFPAELKAISQMSGDESIKGTGYSAENLFKGSYDKGTITRVNETNYFVLILQNN